MTGSIDSMDAPRRAAEEAATQHGCSVARQIIDFPRESSQKLFLVSGSDQFEWRRVHRSSDSGSGIRREVLPGFDRVLAAAVRIMRRLRPSHVQ